MRKGKGYGLPAGVGFIINSDGQKVWHVRKMVKGKRIFKTFGTGKQSQLEARVFAEQITMAKYSSDSTVLPSITISVEEAIKEYFESIKHLSPYTIKSKKASYIRFLTYFKDFQLRNIRSTDLSRFFVNNNDYKYTSLCVLKNNISAFFKFLKSTGYISNIPTMELPVKLSYEAECAKRRKPLSKIDLEIVLERLPDIWWGNTIKIMVFTGMRFSECKNLRWQDVFDTYIFVRKSEQFSPKSLKGERRIPLHPVAKAIIEKNRENGSQYPIPGNNGNLLNNSILSAKWRPFRETISNELKIDISKCRPHDMRHTFGMFMIKGLDLPSLQRVMGHSSIKQTAYYAQQTDDIIQKEIDEKGFPF